MVQLTQALGMPVMHGALSGVIPDVRYRRGTVELDGALVVNVFDGVASQKDDGAFSACSKWGARTDDFLMGGNQIADCFPQSELDKRTLVIMTMGGNDIDELIADVTAVVIEIDDPLRSQCTRWTQCTATPSTWRRRRAASAAMASALPSSKCRMRKWSGWYNRRAGT